MKLKVPLYTYGCISSSGIVEADKLGAFAVHPTIGEFGGSHRFTLTHIKTGRSIHTDLCCKASARALAAAINHLGWNFRNLPAKQWLRISDLPKPIQADFEKAAPIVLNWTCPSPTPSCRKKLADSAEGEES